MTALIRLVRDDDTTPHGRAIRHALVCLDREIASEVCLPLVRTIAETFGAAVTLLHVLPTTTRSDALAWEIGRREAEQWLGRARDALTGTTSRVGTIVSQGPAAELIPRIALELEADLTIVAGRDATSGEGSAIGETAQRVLEATAGSVLVARRSPASASRRIVVPLDGSPRAESVLPSVIALARQRDAEVVLLHVVGDHAAASALARPADLALSRQLVSGLEHSAQAYLERIRERELRELPEVETVVHTRSDERRALPALARELDADLLVLAAHGAGCDPRERFGAAAAHAVHRSSVPVLVMQDVASSIGAPRIETQFVTRRVSQIRRREEA